MIERKEILKRASDSFNKLGIKRVSIDDICFNLSISKKTFYLHYPEKETLINEFIEAEFLKFSQRFKALKSETASSLELMVSYNQYLREEINSKNPAVLFDLQHASPKNLRTYQQQRHVLLNHFEEVLKAGIRSGDFRKSIHPEIIAELRLSQLEMLFLNRYPLNEENEVIQQQLFEHFIQGIIGRK